MGLIDILIIFLILSWIGGFAFQVGGSLIHIILVVAIIMFFVRMMQNNTK